MIAGDTGLMLPLPAVTENVTLTPETGFPWLSVTRTDGAVTEVPTVADAGGVLAAAIVVAVPAVPVALKVTGLPPPTKPVAVAVRLFAPAVVPRVHEPMLA